MALPPHEARYIDDNHVLHPFIHHRLDVEPIHLTSIAHAFNYRIAVLRDGVKPAAHVGRSRRAARQILDNVEIPWSHQMAVMFQIVCALALEVPEVLLELRQLKGVPPNVNLSCEPCRGHMNHWDEDCKCLSSDRTGAYVHELTLATYLRNLISDPVESPDATSAGLSRIRGDRCPDSPGDGGAAHSGTMRLGLVPYVSHRPGAYSSLLLAVCVR